MSDNGKILSEKEMKIEKLVYVIKSVPDRHGMLLVKNFMQQHLEDVLGEVVSITEEKGRQYQNSTINKMAVERVSFEKGMMFVVNLLKQRKG